MLQKESVCVFMYLQVYEATREAADWAELLQPQQTLGVHCLHFFNNSNVTHSQLVQRRVRDAVCDAVRDARCGRALGTFWDRDVKRVC
jgi:23S rRNA G2445 N2-methylase RlmL